VSTGAHAVQPERARDRLRRNVTFSPLTCNIMLQPLNTRYT